jgi:hypothetical protein
VTFGGGKAIQPNPERERKEFGSSGRGTLFFRMEVTNFLFSTTQAFHGNGGGMRKRVLTSTSIRSRYLYITLDSKSTKPNKEECLIDLLSYIRSINNLSRILPGFPFFSTHIRTIYSASWHSTVQYLLRYAANTPSVTPPVVSFHARTDLSPEASGIDSSVQSSHRKLFRTLGLGWRYQQPIGRISW